MTDFTFVIPPITCDLESELFEHSLSAFDSAATRIQRAEMFGDPRAVEIARREYNRVRERACVAALARIKARAAKLRPASRDPSRPRCGARRARPRTRRRRGGGRGGGGGGNDGGDGGGEGSSPPSANDCREGSS